MFSPQLGVGGLVRFTRATWTSTIADGRTHRGDAGGVQGGVRAADRLLSRGILSIDIEH